MPFNSGCPHDSVSCPLQEVWFCYTHKLEAGARQLKICAKFAEWP